MATPFLGEIRMFGGTFAPIGWALCDGQLINVRDNEALFSVIGSTYGGDGRTTFGLPDLRGRLPIHQGSGLALTPRTLGSQGGAETVAVSTSQLPSHNHGGYHASSNTGTTSNPSGQMICESPSVTYYRAQAQNVDIASTSATSSAGGGGAHNNVMPFAVINFIICLTGIIPSQT